jgi:isocitrate lyase
MASNGNFSNSNSPRKQNDWETNPRWKGVTRPYSQADVEKLRGSVRIEHTLAKLGAERLWKLLHEEQFVRALGATTGNQAVQQVKSRSESDLRKWMASGGRCEQCGPNVPGPEFVPC